MKTEYIVYILLFVVIISFVAAGLGLMGEPDFVLVSPDNPTVLNIFGWVVETAWFMLKLVTFQVPEVPTALNMIIVFPMMAGFLYILIRLLKPAGSG